MERRHTHTKYTRTNSQMPVWSFLHTLMRTILQSKWSLRILEGSPGQRQTLFYSSSHPPVLSSFFTTSRQFCMWLVAFSVATPHWTFPAQITGRSESSRGDALLTKMTHAVHLKHVSTSFIMPYHQMPFCTVCGSGMFGFWPSGWMCVEILQQKETIQPHAFMLKWKNRLWTQICEFIH